MTQTQIPASRRVLDMNQSAIHEMTRLSKQYDDVAFLSWAKPTSDTPAHIKEAVIDALQKEGTGGYSEAAGRLELREEIVKKLKRDNQIDADPAEILVTIGAVEGLAAAIMACVDPGDEVILPSPTYSTHVRHVRLASGVPVFVPTIEENGFQLDVDAMREAVTPKTKAILYCSPSNPTGTVFTQEQLRAVADIALEHNLVVITDEAYEYFVFDGQRHVSIASLEGMARNAISCFTFTKTYAMTGWRIGYLHAHRDWVPQINKAHIPFSICAPVISQIAALAALQHSQDCVADYRTHYEAMRDVMCKRLDQLSHVFSYSKPQGSYLMFPRILLEVGQDSAAFCKSLLRDARISTTPGVAFGPTGESHLRLSFCVPEDMIHKAFDRMEERFPA